MIERELTVATKRFQYRGPTSGLTIKADGASRDVLLHDGAELSLPPDHHIVARLVARGHLTPVAAETPAAAPSTTPRSARVAKANTQENS